MSNPPERRSSPRQPASGVAWLTARSCRRARRGERAEAWVADLSSRSIGLRTAMPLQPGDKLEFHGRFFEIALDVDVTVVSARPSPRGESTAAGCEFAGLSGDQRVSLERILLGRAAQEDLGLTAAFRWSA
jgi:hypothetical protein